MSEVIQRWEPSGRDRTMDLRLYLLSALVNHIGPDFRFDSVMVGDDGFITFEYFGKPFFVRTGVDRRFDVMKEEIERRDE
jgi:hypothetical protein